MTTMLDCQSWPHSATSRPARTAMSRSAGHSSRTSNAVNTGTRAPISRLTAWPAERNWPDRHRGQRYQQWITGRPEEGLQRRKVQDGLAHRHGAVVKVGVRVLAVEAVEAAHGGNHSGGQRQQQAEQGQADRRGAAPRRCSSQCHPEDGIPPFDGSIPSPAAARLLSGNFAHVQ